MPRVLVAEPSAPLAAALKKFLAGAADVQVVQYLDEAVQLVRAKPPEVVFASVSGAFDGEVLCARVRSLAPTTAVVLMYAADDERAAERATAQGADSFLVLPMKKAGVLATLRVVLQLRHLREKIATLEDAAAAQLPVVQGRAVGAAFNTGDDAFFKKFLLLEVKRSKRYQYPVSLLMVSLDGLSSMVSKDKSPEAAKLAIRADALAVMAEVIREVDLAMMFGEEKYLLFLPHTAPLGAAQVAERVLKSVAAMKSYKNGPVSVGVASHDPTRASKATAVSYGALVRDASAALKRAIAAGGNRFEAMPSAPTPPKRSRISMG